MKRTLAMGATAVVLAAGLATTLGAAGAGAASAKAKPLKGTISCTLGASAVTFKPALVATGTPKPDVTKIGTLSLSGCTVSPSVAGAPTGGTAKVTPINSKSNLCSAFVSSASTSKFKLSIKWTGGSAPAVSTAVFVGATPSASGFSLNGGKVTGSFATPNGASATVNASAAGLVNILNCGSVGLPTSASSLGVTGGSTTV